MSINVTSFNNQTQAVNVSYFHLLFLILLHEELYALFDLLPVQNAVNGISLRHGCSDVDNERETRCRVLSLYLM